jgi:hypothetical protein
LAGGKDGGTDAEEILYTYNDVYSTALRYLFTRPEVYLPLGFERAPGICHSELSDYKLTVLDR